MCSKFLICLLLSLQILFGCVESISDTPAAPTPGSQDSNSCATNNNCNTGNLKYCGSEILPPWKQIVCERFCEEATCHNFYCECKRLPSKDKNCISASETGKCAKYCEKANYATALHCPSPNGRPYCVCS